MSLAVGAVSSSKNMGFDENKEGGEKSTRETVEANREADGEGKRMSRQMSETSVYSAEEEEDDEGNKLELGPQYTLKQQLEKDKVCFWKKNSMLLSNVFCFFFLFFLPFFGVEF